MRLDPGFLVEVKITGDTGMVLGAKTVGGRKMYYVRLPDYSVRKFLGIELTKTITVTERERIDCLTKK